MAPGLGAAVALTLGAVACSDDDGERSTTTPDPTVAAAADDDGGDLDPSAGSGATGGSAALTIGDATWEFDTVQCAFGEDEIGIEGATWNMAARDGSLSFYAAIDPDATYIELADLADEDAANLMATGDVDIDLDGKRATSNATFIDVNGDTSLELSGTMNVVCP